MEIASREFSPDAGPSVAASPVPRPEYPRPQFARAEWLCLNGTWEFEIDRDDSGEASGYLARSLSDIIIVPFAPESTLSGVGDTDFLEAVWYRRSVDIPQSWSGRRILLHLQASDHDTTVWVNSIAIGRHRGGFTPFTLDITDALRAEGPSTIVVRARDGKATAQARGKQSTRQENYEAFYSRSTGIWQTVWLEPVDSTHLERPRITPDLAAGTLTVEAPITNPVVGTTLEIVVSDADGEVGRTTVDASLTFNAVATLAIPSGRRRAWSPEDPHLYGLRFLVRLNGVLIDEVESYAGLRSVAVDGHRVLLNGKPVFQRLVLDQGWYPDGLMTAPSDEALIADIELAQQAGFNGARLHQKVFEERFLFHADRLGYLVWGEFADWGARVDGVQRPSASFVTQWIEAVNRDYSHPSIIGWCPLNETFEPLADTISELDDVTLGMYLATKAIDGTRPVLDASGYSHRVPGADIYDSHNYEQDPVRFADQMGGLGEGRAFVNAAPDGGAWSVPYAGQPYFCSEFGGIWWAASEQVGESSWGYGEAPRTVEEWHERAGGLMATLLDDPRMFGYCFTQLTDVFQEKNGIYTFDRKPKFDMARVRGHQSGPAAIEQELTRRVTTSHGG